jgi:hypothetical protein
VAKLSAEEVAAIDNALLAQIGDRWRKVAMVVAMVMSSDEAGRRLRIPDIYYATRVREFARAGLIESQGNLRRMRFSEVRRRTAAPHPNGLH